MVLKRYLINFSYIGTLFRGLQRQTSRGIDAVSDPSTVQGLLEIAIEKMKPKNPVITYCASRTDQGVHALRSAATVDLDFSYEPPPNIIHKFLNDFFEDTKLPIRVQEVRQVPFKFNARKMPLWRKYIYRFATLKPDCNPNELSSKTLPIPIIEFDRCYFVNKSNFDLEAVNRTCQLFIGSHDFVAFMGKINNPPEDLSTLRVIHQLYVEPSQPFIPSYFDDYYNYWHLTCAGKSFLYNQIRRTMSVLLAIAQGKLLYDDVQLMLMEPSPTSYPSSLPLAPACGLYLADIFYDPADMELSDNEEKTDVPSVKKKVEQQKTNKELLKERLELMKSQKEKDLSTS